MVVDPVSIPEAAKALDLSASRVQALVARGQIPAIKVGGRWLIERGALDERQRAALRGRPFAAHNAWALLCLASGGNPGGIDPSVRSRLRRAIALEGVEGLGPRLARRAESRHFSAHPGEIPYILKDPGFVESGVSAAAVHGFDLASSWPEADGYLRASALEEFIAAHALRPAGGEVNLHIRLVPDEAWRFLDNAPVAPLAAVALDLAEDPDPRSSQAGHTALQNLRVR